MTKYNPPYWHPTAIPSNEGWRDPNTKELLVAFNGLKDKINLTEKIEAVSVLSEEPPVVDVIPTEEVQTNEPLVEDHPKKKASKKKKEV